MAKAWPFGKKSIKPRQIKQSGKRKIIVYERKQDDSSESKMADRSHLEDAAFKDAMALLGDDSKEQ
jgi:hypothetical protein